MEMPALGLCVWKLVTQLVELLEKDCHLGVGLEVSEVQLIPVDFFSLMGVVS